MEASLEDQKPTGQYPVESDELKVTVPLSRCLSGLKEKYNTIARIHSERFEQVKSKISYPSISYWLTLSRTCSSTRVLLVTS